MIRIKKTTRVGAISQVSREVPVSAVSPQRVFVNSSACALSPVLRVFAVFVVAVLVLTLYPLKAAAYENNENAFLADYADFLTPEEEDEIFKEMKGVSAATDWKIGIVTTAEDYSDSGATRAAEDFFDDYFGADAAGVLLLMDSANGNYVLHITVTGYAKSLIRDDDAIDIFEHIKPSFERYDEYQTAMTFLDDVVRYRNGGSLPKPVNLKGIFIAIIAALIAVAIAAGVIWGRYHSHPKISASAYLNRGSVNLYRRNDRFVREYTTRTRNSSSSSGRSSGGHHGGGRHGGGGGRGHR